MPDPGPGEVPAAAAAPPPALPEIVELPFHSASELKAPVKLGLGPPSPAPGCLVSKWQQLRAVSSLSGPARVAQPGGPFTAFTEGAQGPQGLEMATHSSTRAWKIHGRRGLVGYSPWGHK